MGLCPIQEKSFCSVYVQTGAVEWGLEGGGGIQTTSFTRYHRYLTENIVETALNTRMNKLHHHNPTEQLSASGIVFGVLNNS